MPLRDLSEARELRMLRPLEPCNCRQIHRLGLWSHATVDKSTVWASNLISLYNTTAVANDVWASGYANRIVYTARNGDFFSIFRSCAVCAMVTTSVYCSRL